MLASEIAQRHRRNSLKLFPFWSQTCENSSNVYIVPLCAKAQQILRSCAQISPSYLAKLPANAESLIRACRKWRPETRVHAAAYKYNKMDMSMIIPYCIRAKYFCFRFCWSFTYEVSCDTTGKEWDTWLAGYNCSYCRLTWKFSSVCVALRRFITPRRSTEDARR